MDFCKKFHRRPPIIQSTNLLNSHEKHIAYFHRFPQKSFTSNVRWFWPEYLELYEKTQKRIFIHSKIFTSDFYRSMCNWEENDIDFFKRGFQHTFYLLWHNSLEFVSVRSSKISTKEVYSGPPTIYGTILFNFPFNWEVNVYKFLRKKFTSDLPFMRHFSLTSCITEG